MVFNCNEINLKKGSQGTLVSELQTILKERGLYTRAVESTPKLLLKSYRNNKVIAKMVYSDLKLARNLMKQIYLVRILN